MEENSINWQLRCGLKFLARVLQKAKNDQRNGEMKENSGNIKSVERRKWITAVVEGKKDKTKSAKSSRKHLGNQKKKERKKRNDAAAPRSDFPSAGDFLLFWFFFRFHLFIFGLKLSSRDESWDGVLGRVENIKNWEHVERRNSTT